MSLLPAMLGFFGGAASAVYNQNNAEQAAEDAYNRQRSLMAYQNGYAVQNWNREVAYNSPIEQMRRLKEGDLNPNLVYGSGAVGLEAPGTSSPGSPSAPMAQTIPMSNPIAEGAQAAQAIAMAKQAGATAVKTSVETEYLEKTMQQRIDAVALQNGWTKEQTAKFKQEFAVLVGQCNIMQKQVQNLDITNKNLDEKLKAEIADLKSSANYQNALKGLTDSQKSLLDQTMDNLVSISRDQSKFMSETVRLLGKYGDAQAIVGMLSQVVSSITDILTSYAKIFPKKPK